MSWNHIVVEGYCLFDEKKDIQRPACCQGTNGMTGLYCLEYDEQSKWYCPYFAFGKADSTVVLTDGDGKEIAFSAFSSDENIENEEEWVKKQAKWLVAWKEIILKGLSE